jgi:lipopolysaccharide/colanic/teichoic acid biosynthesis glycosyltransferase
MMLMLLFAAGALYDTLPATAITLFNDPSVNYKELSNAAPKIIASRAQHKDKTSAPEPATILLFLSGITGALIRFARKSFRKCKRYLDLFLSILGMLITAPLVAYAAALIKLHSRGPVIYRQKRVGKNGTVFKIYKLRTMYVDAEKETGAIWAKTNDPRITPIGRILRKTHIDEIPQLFNVLKGEMSIVGPRPERPEMVRDLKKLITDYEKRLEVTPGITGLAQVWYKYDETIEDVKKKVKYDLFLDSSDMGFLIKK